MMNYPLTNDCRICINPFSNLLLLYTERENVDRKDALTSITENAFDIIHRPKAINYFQVMFLEKALNLLIQTTYFRATFRNSRTAFIRDVEKC